VTSSDEIDARRHEFRRLHEAGCFVMPNPWDVGSARYLQHLGFPAVATTSGGMAFARGLPDDGGAVPVDAVIDHCAEIVGGVSVPVNADFQSGYADDPDGVAANVVRCAGTGVAGLSIEDIDVSRTSGPLYPLEQAVERVRAARAALDGGGSAGDVLLTARTEAYLMGVDEPQAVALERLPAFAEAGADVLYAPGVARPDDIAALVAAVAPKPVNVLVSPAMGLSVADVAALGVRRISVGSALARKAWAGFVSAATELAERGSFSGLGGGTPHSELDDLFSRSGVSDER
jgi:2-methylisocitrate lyase-like PEP mutase family enzyme